VVILDNPFYDYRTRSLLNEEKTMEMIKRFFKEEDGATLVEYAILVALIAVAVIGTVFILGGQINAAFQSVVDALPAAPAAPANGG
jgi:pilus assembly protein Flp/PilA